MAFRKNSTVLYILHTRLSALPFRTSKCHFSSLSIPYTPPMQLGTVYNLINGRVYPFNIFKKEIIDQKKVTNSSNLHVDYKVVESSEDVRNFLNISPSVSLNTKFCGVGLSASGKYLIEFGHRENVLEILGKISYTTCIESLPPNIQATPNLMSNLPTGLQPTHYINTITHGGEAIFSLQHTLKENVDKKKLGADLGVILPKFLSSILSKTTIKPGKFEIGNEISNSVKNSNMKCWTQPTVHAKVQSIDDIQLLVQEIQKVVSNTNEGFGVPVSATIQPIGLLDPQYPVLKLPDERVLYKLDDAYDDLKTAQKRLQLLYRRTCSVHIDQRTKSEIETFAKKIEGLLQIFDTVIPSLALGDIPLSQLCEPAFDSYGVYIPNKYTVEFDVLKKKVLLNEQSPAGKINLSLHHDSDSNKVIVNLLQACSLPDTDVQGTPSKPDPYVVVKFLPSQQAASTVAQKNTAHPVFHETFEFELLDHTVSRILVQVWDDDPIYNDLIGETEISCSNIINSNGHIEDWFHLEPRLD